jgi:hypothetical protein
MGDDRLPPFLKRQAAAPLNQPGLMEPSSETLDGFVRHAVSEGDASYLEDILKTRTVNFIFYSPSRSVMSFKYVFHSLLSFSVVPHATPHCVPIYHPPSLFLSPPLWGRWVCVVVACGSLYVCVHV